MDSFIKPTASTMFGHPLYLLDGPGLSIEISVPHEDFFISSFRMCIGEKNLHVVLKFQLTALAYPTNIMGVQTLLML